MRELGADAIDITKKGPGSNILMGRIKEFLQNEGGDDNDK
jgi:glycerol-3-phosphate dehydrogenase